MSKRVSVVRATLFAGVDLSRLAGAMMDFKGDARILEAAAGAWLLGCLVGGRGLELIHTRESLERYARALGFGEWRELRELLPDNGPKTKDLAVLKLRKRFRVIVQSLVAAARAGDGGQTADV